MKKNILDLFIGTKIKMRRAEIEMTEEKFAELIETTSKNVKKYEAGEKTIYISELFDFADALDTSASYFVKDVDEVVKIFNNNSFDIEKDADKLVKIIYSIEKFK